MLIYLHTSSVTSVGFSEGSGGSAAIIHTVTIQFLIVALLFICCPLLVIC